MIAINFLKISTLKKRVNLKKVKKVKNEIKIRTILDNSTS